MMNAYPLYVVSDGFTSTHPILPMPWQPIGRRGLSYHNPTSSTISSSAARFGRSLSMPAAPAPIATARGPLWAVFSAREFQPARRLGLPVHMPISSTRGFAGLTHRHNVPAIPGLRPTGQHTPNRTGCGGFRPSGRPPQVVRSDRGTRPAAPVTSSDLLQPTASGRAGNRIRVQSVHDRTRPFSCGHHFDPSPTPTGDHSSNG